MKFLSITLLFSLIALFGAACSSTSVTNRDYNSEYGYRVRNYQPVPYGWNVSQGGGGTDISFEN